MSNKQPNIVRHIPTALVILRVVIAVFLVLDALDGKTGAWFVAGFIIASLSDALDGMIARRFNVATTMGSMLDGYADVVLYGAVLWCIWLAHREVIKAFSAPLLVLAATQLISWLISLARYGRITSYHSYIAKAWAVAIFAAVVSLFAFNYPGIFFWLVIILGVISNIEDISITLIIPRWSHDVSSIPQALVLRKKNF